MEALSEILRDATAAIADGYFHLHIDGGAPIYRERVYCYELYHQMRCRWPPDCPYLLSGEVDKRAHPILRRLDAEFHTPDFLVHTPGAMAGNNTIIEVKHALAPADGILKDIETLDLFVREVQYRRAIFLVYGSQADGDLARKITRLAAALNPGSSIELWLHAQVARAAVHTVTLASSA